MTKKLYETPKNWLTPDVCARLFKIFREKLEFDEPIPPFEIRFEGRLESILSSVRQSFNDRFLNKTVLDAAAAYFNQLIRGHPFQNGNKRMAVLFTHIFLLLHGIDFTLRFNEMYNFAIFIARASENGIDSETTKQWCKEVIEEFTEEKR